MDELTLATTRYSSWQLIEESGLVPLGITVSLPRFRLRYELAGSVGMLAPSGLLAIEDRAEFEAAYRARLDRIGIKMMLPVLRGFAEAYDAPGCVLCCYEDLAKPGEWCHRRLFADWWEERTGQAVPELEPLQLGFPQPFVG